MVNDSEMPPFTVVGHRLTCVTAETGALFRLSLELLVLNSEASISDSTLESLSSLVSLLGQYFQIRDDYMNLIDNKVRFPQPTPPPGTSKADRHFHLFSTMVH